MNRDEILKSVGFTEDFLKTLHEFEKAVPEIHYDAPFDLNSQEFKLNDTTGQLIITKPNDNYYHNLIVKQG